MTGILLRTIFAVVAVVVLFVLIPVVFRVVGMPLSADVWMILRVCIAGLAVLYIAFGKQTPPL